jgi:hypothetical protein
VRGEFRSSSVLFGEHIGAYEGSSIALHGKANGT